jgi:hypothetical protein
MSRQLVEKWSKAPGTLSIAGINDQYVKDNLAVLLENQRQKDLGQELFLESGFGTGGGNVATNGVGNVPAGGAGNGVFAPISMALVRRTFPALFANKVVGVQAMSTPVGLAYAIRYVYKDGNEAGVGMNEVAWDRVPEYSGFTGSTSGTSGTADAGQAVATNTAEAWNVNQGSHSGGVRSSYPQLTFQIDRQPIEAKTRKLATSFSLEAAMDVKAMHDIEVERELINMIQYELVAEQDRELLARIKAAAVVTTKAVTSDGQTLRIDAGGEAAKTFDITTSDGRWSQEKFSTIITAIVDRANAIAIATRRGAGNFVIVSPSVATALQAAGPQFNRNTSFVDATTIFPEIGTINDTIKVYRDQYATSDYALVGYKGPGISDAGIIYSPYVTGLVSRTVAQEDFSPRIGIMSRYAITDSLLGSGRYYRLINFTNLQNLLLGQWSSVTRTSAI